MAKYKPYDYSQTMMVPVSLSDQLVAGTLEHTIHYMVEERLDLADFDARYRNDETGRLAYDPKVLLKIVLFGYSRGLKGSRKLERACRDNITFMALTCGQAPDHSTIAEFFEKTKGSLTEAMKAKIDTPEGRRIYSKRLGNVEPVFANLRAQKSLDRFTLRGQNKVNVQWKLYCLVHNLEKLGKYGIGRN